jgi:hypothetical protein
MAIGLQRSAFFEALGTHAPLSTAIVHHGSDATYSYGSLQGDVACTKEHLERVTGRNESTIAGERIAFLVENGYDYVGMNHASFPILKSLTLYRGLTMGETDVISIYSHATCCFGFECHRFAIGAVISSL